MTGFSITALSASDIETSLPELAHLLHACVQDGASVNFVLPYALVDAETFWTRRVLGPVREGGLVVLVAIMNGSIVGSVQLDHDTVPNQRHRAEVRKLLVLPEARRKGIARALLVAIEAEARRLGRTLLTLDTRTGDSAEPLYIQQGYVAIGSIPRYARDTKSDRLDGATFMYKWIGE